MIETREQIMEYFTRHNYDFLPGKDPNTFQPFPGAMVLDIGMNLGMVSAFWAMNGCYVTAYEADPITYKIATDMFDRVGLRVDAKNLAVWTYAGEVTFRGIGHLDGYRECRNGKIELSPESIWLPCVRFADVLSDTIWDCVKIDIEGAEYQILMSTDLEAMKNIKYMNLEIHENKYSPDWATPDQIAELWDKLTRLFDITVSTYGPGFWHLRNKCLE